MARPHYCTIKSNKICLNQQISAERGYKNDNSAYFPFLIMSPDPYFTLFSFLDHNSGTIRNIQWYLVDYRTGQYKVSHARMTALLVFIY